MALRLALAQINATVGDIAGNKQTILARLAEAKQKGADIVLFPELAVTGYPPEDLLLKPSFLRAAEAAVMEIAAHTQGVTAIVGAPHADGDLYNAAYILHDGKLAGIYHKQYLPNYGVFDESRYFQSGRGTQTFVRKGHVVGVTICEDIWYPDGPAESQATQGGAELLLNISSSPYFQGKGRFRERMLGTRAADSVAFLAYCNLVGGQDELVFDGQSVVFGPQGEVLARAPQFEEALLVVDVDVPQAFRARLGEPRLRRLPPTGEAPVTRTPLPDVPAPVREAIQNPVAPLLDPVSEVYQALVLGTRDYVRKNGFKKVVLGVSGGIDSALTAAIAADALGAENVAGVAMPTRYSSGHSLKDAEQLCANFGIRFMTVPIDGTFQAFLDMLAPAFSGTKPDLTEENLQPRIRGTLLMALSNKFGWLVLTTGNKSEVSVGYSTLYGDTAGGFAVIKDVPKMLVYELSRHRNRVAGREMIPVSSIEKAPSAELRPDQKDSDTLPEYPVLDAILHAYVEESLTPQEIAARGFDEKTVREVIRRVDINEYKRRQSPPGVKITPRAFGKDWRLPITNRYRDH